MDARAIIDGYDMPPQARKTILARLLRVVADEGSSKREVSTAARALLSVERCRLEAIKLEIAAESSDQQIDGTDPEEALRIMRNDTEYVEYLRQKALTDAVE